MATMTRPRLRPRVPLPPENPPFGTDGLWTFTPALSLEWLTTHMAPNRPLKPAQLARLKVAMHQGWQVNGETLKVDTLGHCFDGQHRLTASVETGCTFQTYVVFGLPSHAQETVDLGLKRSPGDYLALRGEHNVNNLGATLRWVWRYEQDQLRGYNAEKAPTMDTLYALLQQWPSIRDSLVYGQATYRLITKSLGAALYHLMSRIDEEAAGTFFTTLASGEGLYRGQPLYLLRQRLVANSQAKAKLSTMHIAALTIKAWKATQAGETMRYLKWQEDGGEAFPRVEHP